MTFFTICATIPRPGQCAAYCSRGIFDTLEEAKATADDLYRKEEIIYADVARNGNRVVYQTPYNSELGSAKHPMHRTTRRGR
jgi:hypothetical protein